MVEKTIPQTVPAPAGKQARQGLPGPLAETISSNSIFVSMPNSSAMMDLMQAFGMHLRTKHNLGTRLLSLDSDPRQGYALIGCFKAYQTADAAIETELSTVRLYHDTWKGRLFMEISCTSQSAMDLMHSAISPSISTAIDKIGVKSLELPIVVCRDISHLDAEGPKGESSPALAKA